MAPPAHDQWQAGNVETVICLVPVRTDSAWFYDTLSADANIYLLQGRVRFLSPQGKGQHTPQNGPGSDSRLLFGEWSWFVGICRTRNGI